MSNQSPSYANYKEKQLRLAKMLKDASGTISALNMNQFRDGLSALGSKVGDDTFKLMVAGTFKNGKSTFINSFLGSEVLPAYAVPCTAVINEVKYGKTKRAVLYFKHPLPKQMPDNIPEKAKAHMRKYKGMQVPPIEIPYDEIEEYAVIPMDKDPKEMLMESPYEKIELFWPLDLLENGVEIIDSPGLNEHATRTQVSTGYLDKADAVLFTLLATQQCSAEEMRFIDESLKGKGFEDIYFIVNKFDQVRPNQRDSVIQFVKRKVSDKTSFGENGIFFVSALDALEGKMGNDSNLYENSGMPDFEKTLADFLVNQKGKAKLSQPARELKRILNEEALFKVIPQQRSMLETDLNELKKRYNDAKPKLDQLVKKKDQLRERARMQISQMMPEIRRYINAYFADTCDNLPVWIDEIEVESKVSVNPLKTKESIHNVCEEIFSKLTPRLEDEQAAWVDNTLKPLVADKVELLRSSLESGVENILIDLDSIRTSISGFTPESDGVLASGASRAGAAITGFLLGLGGGGVTGSITGFNKDFAKSVAGSMAAYIALIAVFGWNPFVLIPAIVISMIAGGAIGGATAVRKCKEKIAAEVANSIQTASGENTEQMVAAIEAEITKIADLIVNGLDSEIKEIEIQVKDIISQLERGQAQAEEKKALLDKCEDTLRIISRELDDFIFQLIA